MNTSKEAVFFPCCNVFSTVAIVGFTHTTETQLEDGGSITVCVGIFSPMIDGPVAYPFDIAVRTTDGTAGI